MGCASVKYPYFDKVTVWLLNGLISDIASYRKSAKFRVKTFMF